MSLAKVLAKVVMGVIIAKTVGGVMGGKGSAQRGQGTALPQSRGGRVGRSYDDGLDEMMGDIFARGRDRRAGGRPVSERRAEIEEMDRRRQARERDVAGQPGADAPWGRSSVPEPADEPAPRRDPFEEGAGPVVMREPGAGDGPWGQTSPARATDDAPPSGRRRNTTPLSEEDHAALMLRAMIQAAKSDGRIDRDEQARIMGSLSEATAEDMQFLRQLLQAPIDIAGLSRGVPQGYEEEVYEASLMAIRLDNRVEAAYLRDLAAALGLSRNAVTQLHQAQGAPLPWNEG
ncbi:MAG: DUF533 domain-containing protein [Paracoccaceae bacterium]